MPAYILYSLDEAGKIARSEPLEAKDDAAALEQARALAGPHGCEVWQRERIVGRVGAKGR